MVQFILTSPVATIGALDELLYRLYSFPGTALAAFYVPVGVMVFLYAKVYYVTATRHKELAKFQVNCAFIPSAMRINVINTQDQASAAKRRSGINRLHQLQQFVSEKSD